MKKTLWALAALAMMVGFTACDAEEGDECSIDTDCAATDKTLICSNNVCVAPDCGKLYCGGKDKCILAEKSKDGLDHCVGAQVAKVCAEDANKWFNHETGLCENAELAACETDSQCPKDQHCNTTSRRCDDGPAPAEFKYVRIDDLSDVKKGAEDPGADIDAVVLKKSSGSTFYAKEVIKYERAASFIEDKTSADPNMALNEPDSFVGYPTNTTKCYYFKQGLPNTDKTQNRPFVSLGGKGGYLVVEMGGAIEAGDTLSVLELGNCSLQNTKDGGSQTGNAEGVKVQVSVAADSQWKIVGDSEGMAGDGKTNKFNGIYTATITEKMLKGTN